MGANDLHISIYNWLQSKLKNCIGTQNELFVGDCHFAKKKYPLELESGLKWKTFFSYYNKFCEIVKLADGPFHDCRVGLDPSGPAMFLLAYFLTKNKSQTSLFLLAFI